jgi:hypothetical protein
MMVLKEVKTLLVTLTGAPIACDRPAITYASLFVASADVAAVCAMPASREHPLMQPAGPSAIHHVVRQNAQGDAEFVFMPVDAPIQQVSTLVTPS